MTNLELIRKASRQYCKQANDAPTFYDAVQRVTAKALQRKALANAGTVALAGLGSGAGLRGLIALMEMSQSGAKPGGNSLAAGRTSMPQDPSKEKTASLAEFLRGDYAKSVAGVPWAIPAAVGAGAAGAYGGWRGIDELLDRRRKGELDEELEEAKREYEAALAGEGKLAQDLDTLYDEVEKQAAVSDAAGTAAGLYGLYGGTSALVAALMAYQWGKKRQKRQLLEAAQTKRRRRRYAGQPIPVQVTPVPKREHPEPLESDDSKIHAAPSL